MGSHLAEYLLTQKDIELYGLYRHRSKTDHIEHIKDKIKLVDADLMDSHSLYATISEMKPDVIYHLAAQSFVPTSWGSPAITLEVNIVGSANLLKRSSKRVLIQLYKLRVLLKSMVWCFRAKYR